MTKFTQPARKFGNKRYHLYTNEQSKRNALAEAKHLRANGWLVRIVHSSLGYDIYTTR